VPARHFLRRRRMSTQFRWFRRSLAVLGTLGAAAVLVTVINRLQSGEETRGAEAAAKPAPNAPVAAADAAERTVAVTVAPIAVQKVQRSVGAVGTFYGFDELTVAAEVSGRVAQVFHDVGDIVQPGDVLLEIDPTDYALAVEEKRREIELDATRIGLREYVPADKDFTPDNVQKLLDQVFKIDGLPRVISAKEEMENAALRLERAEKLVADRALAREDYTGRSKDLKVAQANYEQARWDSWAIVAGIKYRLVQLRTALRKLELTTVRVPTPTQRTRSPKDVKYGVVERKVTEGEMVKDAPGMSTATFQLVMDGVLKLKAAVPERFVSQVQVGQAVRVHVDAYPNREFPGEVIAINPMIDRTSRTFTVEVYVDNPRRELKAGGFAKVDILTHVDPQAWTVPVDAIVTYAGSTKIFVIREGRAHTVPIATGLEGRGWVELVRPPKSDLRSDDQVITSGHEKLAEGVAVQVRTKGEGPRSKDEARSPKPQLSP